MILDAGQVHSDTITSIIYSSDNTIMTSSKDYSLKLHQLTNDASKLIHIATTKDDILIFSIAACPTKESLVAAVGEELVLFDTNRL